MKNLSKLLTLMVALAITLNSCSDDDPVIEPVPFGLSVKLDEGFGNQAVENVTVTLLNTATNDTYTLSTDAQGKVDFTEVNPGSYNISATINYTAEEFKIFFGTDAPSDEVTFNASLENININSLSTTAEDLILKTSKIGDLLLKQIYFAGSDVKEGAVFRDLFFEVYNNSNEVIYADGLYFGQAYGRTTSSIKDYTLDNGQYDWTQSINQTKGDKSNTDYLYADHVYQFPGTGEEYPINPGESMVVAGTAINHKQPLVVGEDTYSINNPDLTIDLSGADFEVFLQDYLTEAGSNGLASDIDNPTVPNMKVAYRLNAKELILDPLGRDAFVIFRSDDFESFAKLPNPQSTSVTSTTRLYVQIPNSVIIDGVETNRSDASKLVPRRLSTALDGGYMFTPAGPYSSQSIIRKVSKNFGDRKVLQDTNNSTNDFMVIDRPLPGSWPN